MYNEARQSAQLGANSNLAAVPREPSLTDKMQQLMERCGSLHDAFSGLVQQIDRVIPAEPPSGSAGENTVSPQNVDQLLAQCLTSLANLEGRMASINARMEHYI